MSRRRPGFWIMLGILSILLGTSGRLLWREWRQEQLDHQLIAAIKRNDPSRVILLLDRGADANARALSPEARPFWRLLLDHLRGIHPSRKVALPALLVALDVAAEREGSPPVYRDTTAIVKALLDHGAGVNVAAKNGETPLLIAAEHQQWRTVALLLDRGVPIDVADSHGDTLLMPAVQAKEAGIVQRLLERGARVNAANEEGETALHVAVDVRDAPSVRRLLDKGAKVNVRDNQGETPLHRAAATGAVQVIRCLLDRGANVNARDKDWNTPLMLAACYGSVAGVRLLLDRGADINAEADPPGGMGTALMGAVIEGRLPVVKLLIARGARVDTSITPIVAHPKPISPLSYAGDSQRDDIVAVLKQAGAKE